MVGVLARKDCSRNRRQSDKSAMATNARADSTVPIAILAFPEVTASVLFGLYDLFQSAVRDWSAIVDGRVAASPLRPAIVSADGRPLGIANGVRIVPEASFADVAEPAVLCIPEVFVAPTAALEGRFTDEIAFIRRCHAAGAIVATACSGALLLAEAGLLDGEDATTHWAYCDALAARHPGVKVQPQRSLVTAGEGHRLVMAGGGTSWQDLGLYLVARLVGLDAAMKLARIYLIDWHQSGQQPFARLSSSRQSEDAVITRCQIWVASNYRQPAPVAAMTRLSGLSERSFVRRFQQATGLSPLQYVHSVRLEEAKQMLEASDLPIEAIAEEVGYEDSGFFARLFKRSVNLTPASYRKRFGALRAALREAQRAS
jgi:transcriptional regulator GlxA family with amidase domain